MEKNRPKSLMMWSNLASSWNEFFNWNHKTSEDLLCQDKIDWGTFKVPQCDYSVCAANTRNLKQLKPLNYFHHLQCQKPLCFKVVANDTWKEIDIVKSLSFDAAFWGTIFLWWKFYYHWNATATLRHYAAFLWRLPVFKEVCVITMDLSVSKIIDLGPKFLKSNEWSVKLGSIFVWNRPPFESITVGAVFAQYNGLAAEKICQTQKELETLWSRLPPPDETGFLPDVVNWFLPALVFCLSFIWRWFIVLRKQGEKDWSWGWHLESLPSKSPRSNIWFDWNISTVCNNASKEMFDELFEMKSFPCLLPSAPWIQTSFVLGQNHKRLKTPQS